MIPSISSSGLAVFISDYLPNPYLSPEETSLLIGLVHKVNPRTMIEFGCHLGRTAAVVLGHVKTLQRYYGIDVPSSYEPILDCQRSEIPNDPGLYVREDPRFTLILHPHGSTELSANDLPRCDVAFIDGDHSETAVLHDSRLALELVHPAGMIIWHDYGNEAVEVTRALNQLLLEGWPIHHVQNSWLAFRRV